MTPEFAYFLKVNIAFALFYAFYRLFFYKDTFFKLRRIVLLAFFGLALFYPFLNIQDWLKEQEPIAEVIYIYSSIIAPEAVVTVDSVDAPISWLQVLNVGGRILYIAILLLLAVRFYVQLGSILWLARKSEKQVIQGRAVHALNKPAGPFSFFRLIFIHPASHSEKEMEEILTHECTHVSQWHSIDVILCEIITLVFWFNPFVWLLKREVRHNLEYLADNMVIQAGYDSKSYQYHLLGLAHHHKESTNLYNSFNVLHLKNRIGMMNKRRSRAISRAKYLVFIPLVFLLMVFSNVEAVARLTRQVKKFAVQAPEFLSPDELQIEEDHTPLLTLAEIEDESLPPPPQVITITEDGLEVKKSDMEIQIKKSKVLALYSANKNRAHSKKTNQEAPPPPPPVFAEEEEDLGEHVFTVVEEMPSFPGGDQALLDYIKNTVRYPVTAQENGIQGRVTVSFVVNKDGAVSDAAVSRGVDPSLDKEAVRVVNSMSPWKPGKQRNKPVRVKYTVPIQFRLQ
ncbi:M56 family peptidase [Parabacteroides sp. 52]|nr:M56 family metallopeptidase [Parabacteroides sp. 52]NDV56243.1 M56 family peptidase [Parabacteroides sp. 52]